MKIAFKPITLLMCVSITIIIIFGALLLLSDGKVALMSIITQYLRFDLIAISVNFVFSISLILRKGVAESMVDKERISKKMGYILLALSAFLIPMPFIISVMLGFGIYNPWTGMSQIETIMLLLQSNHVITILTFMPFIAYLIRKYNVNIAVVSTFFMVGLSEFYVAPVIALIFGPEIFLWWWPWYIAFVFMVFPFMILVFKKKLTIDKKYWIYLACTWWIELLVFLPIMTLPAAWSWETHTFIANPALANMQWTSGLTAFSLLGITRRVKDSFLMLFVRRR